MCTGGDGVVCGGRTAGDGRVRARVARRSRRSLVSDRARLYNPTDHSVGGRERPGSKHGILLALSDPPEPHITALPTPPYVRSRIHNKTATSARSQARIFSSVPFIAGFQVDSVPASFTTLFLQAAT